MVLWFRNNQRFFGLACLLALCCVATAPAAQGAATQDDQDVRVQRVLRDPRTAQPVVILADPEGLRGLPIWIGELEAMALESALRGVTHRRPMTHDLLAVVLEKLRAQITRVRVTELREDVFYALIHLQSPEGPLEIDARPSDAMVLAVRTRSPLSVERSLFLNRSVPLELTPLKTLGLELQELTDDLRAVFGYDGAGVLVTQVEPGGAAHQAGLEREDIIVALGETAIAGIEALEQVLREKPRPWKISVVRRGQRLVLTIS